MHRVLEEGGLADHAVGLVAVAGGHRGGHRYLPVHRVPGVEADGGGLADQVLAEELAVLVVHTHQQVVLHAAQLHLAVQVEGGEVLGAHRAPGAVQAAPQRAVGVPALYPRLVVVVGVAVVAVGEVGLPGLVQLVFEVEDHQVRPALGDVVGLVQAALGGHRQGLAVDEDGAAVKGGAVLAVLEAEVHRGVFAVPGDGGGEGLVAAVAEVAPVVGVVVVGDHPVGQAGIPQGAGDVEGAAAAVLAVAVGGGARGDGAVGLQLRFLADDVDHAARVEDAVEHRGRALEHFHALGAGGEVTALDGAHAVAQDRAVAVVAEAAFHHRVQGAAEGVGLGDAADVGQGVVEILWLLVHQRLGRDHGHRLGDVQQRGVAAGQAGGGRWLVAGGAFRLAGAVDVHRAQVEGVGAGHRHQRQGPRRCLGEAETAAGQQTRQGLLGAHPALHARCIAPFRQGLGVDHRQPGAAGEGGQGRGQGLRLEGEDLLLRQRRRGLGQGLGRPGDAPQGEQGRDQSEALEGAALQPR